ncbi:TIM-barrel domain-containing protein [Virgisporangium ochraceum]|uniref:Alpha-xylosidase n=1 Tax=Virgisporangium ochraceum TaxID=65505 RepID=A0A8J3ZR93_9ACTN|nr:TIM-barrel domain-containing protein [Virgisporangium ochraceum]GIJ67563.1 alpha-xylosidase [Virgisporangium ochraceum]
MPFRPPLVPFETFVADPPDLPVRGPGDAGPSVLTRAEVLGTDVGGATFKGTTSDGSSLVVRVGAAGDGVLRVRLSAEPDARSRSAAAIALVRPAAFAATVEVTDGTVRIGAGAVTAEITLDPWHLRFVDAAGTVLLEQDRGERDISGRVRTLPFGRSLAGGEVAAYHESFVAPALERFVGLGEKFTRLDKRGQRALMWNFDAFGSESDRSHKVVPLYLSNRGYGVLVDSGMPVEFDMGQSTHSCVQILVPDDLLDYYVIAGPAPADILKRYNALTTAPLLPPKWAFGTWISSGFFVDTQEHVMARAENIRRRGIPCDVLHLDCYWQVDGHWSDLRWDASTFPDPEGMLASLKEQGFRVCLWINPYVSHLAPAFEANRDHFLKKADGSVYVADVWHGSYPACGIIDLTNPAAVEWFANDLRALLRQGVAVFKTDFAEGVPADAVAHNGMRGVELHNVYTLLFNDIVSKVTREVAGHGMVWARSSFLGGQRHSAQWSGDVNASYPGMASTLRGGLSHGVSGVPFWSHDAGGFNGTPTPDLYVRWSQFGALSPLVRLHGTTSRLPWDFPADAERHATEALRMRYTLMPYLYSAAVESARTGVPMLRALLVDSPDDPAAWTADLEYRLGADLLVAPMVDPSGEREVYLPGGTWLDYWTGEAVTGGRYVRVSQPVDRIPLFVRDGALILVTEPGDAVGDGPFTDLTVVSWGGGDGRTVLRDVDGDSSVVAVRSGDTLAVDVTGPAQVRRVTVAPVPGRLTPTRITLNGVPV